MKVFIQRHYLMLLYTLLFAGILYGVITTSGSTYLPGLLLYAFVFFGSYFLIGLLRNRLGGAGITERLTSFALKIGFAEKFALVAFAGVIGFIALHYVILDGVPVLKALRSVSYQDIIEIRNDVSLVHPAVNYLASFLIRAVIPFFMVYFYVKKKPWLFYLFLLISVFYAVSLLQKNYILMIFFPLVFFTLLKLRWFDFLKFIVVVAVGIGFLVVVTNPALRSDHAVIQSEEQTSAPAPVDVVEAPAKGSSKLVLITQAVARRVFVVPGDIVAKWFEAIPDQKPFLNGCGYHFLTPFMDCEFRNYAKELYPVIHPTRAEQGLVGTVNAAHFMYDYANFGWRGLVLAAILLALVLHVVQLIFSGEFFYGLIFNSFFILMLSSSALSTLLFSGGWALMILLFFLFRNALPSAKRGAATS